MMRTQKIVEKGLNRQSNRPKGLTSCCILSLGMSCETQGKDNERMLVNVRSSFLRSSIRTLWSVMAWCRWSLIFDEWWIFVFCAACDDQVSFCNRKLSNAKPVLACRRQQWTRAETSELWFFVLQKLGIWGKMTWGVVWNLVPLLL